jgi:hypothetical protein
MNTLELLKLKKYVNKQKLCLKVMSIYQNDKSDTGKVMFDNFRKLAIRNNEKLENDLIKPQKK